MTVPHEPPHEYGMDAEPMARCYNHPDRETSLSCTRCERPICPDCLRSAAVGYQCPECARSGRTREATLPYGGKIFEQAGLVTIVLAALNIAAYLITGFTSVTGFTHNEAAKLFKDWVLVPADVANDHEYWRMISSAFLHYGPIHILANMISLAVLGPGLERVLGRLRFATLYVVSALGGSVAVYLFDNSLNRVAGASAAIFGLFGALVVVYRKLGLDIRALLPTLLINAYITWRVPEISWLGHVGGFVVGLITATVIVYAPRAQRNAVQIMGVGTILAVMMALTLWRTGAITR